MLRRQTVLLISLLGLFWLSGCGDGFDTDEAEPILTPTPLPTPVTVLETTISADGQIVLPVPPQTFGFPAGIDGRIQNIYVIPGQRVSEGQLLAEIDDTDLRNALRRAEASLLITQAEADNQAVGPRASEILQAQASLEAARQELVRLQTLPSEEAIRQAAADLSLQQVELRRAQEAYDEIAYADDVGLSPQAAELQQATLNYEKAEAAYQEAIKPADEAELASARSRVVDAEARLDELNTGLADEAIILSEARLNQARLEVAEARANLPKAKLYAPWDGLVTEVNASPGLHVSNANIVLVQTSPLRFATENFSERNLPDVEIGDQATIYLKAYSGVPLPAVIQRIAFESTERDGDTALFTVYFDFNSGDFAVRPGMTGRVEINIEPPQ